MGSNMERVRVSALKTRANRELTTEDELQCVVHELQVHQVELEIQHETLLRARHDIAESRVQYQELFESAPVSYVMLDYAGRVVRANGAALTLLGGTTKAVHGRLLSAFVVAEDSECLNEHIRRAHEDGKATCEVRLPSHADDERRTCQIDMTCVPGSGRGCLMVMTDVSDRKRRQLTLQALNRDLLARDAELERQNQRLECERQARVASDARRRELQAQVREAAHFESIGLLAAGIAHDFNNLLATLLGNTELLLCTPALVEQDRAPLSLIQAAGHQASELTRQLLAFAGGGELSLSAVDLAAVVVDTLALLRARAPAGISIKQQLAGSVPAIRADRARIDQVIMNLVTNAIEASDGRGTIEIRTRAERLGESTLAQYQHHSRAKPGEFAILEVRDHGLGIDAPTMTRMFDPFFSTKFTGRGLGLAEVLGIVQSHGGALRMRSTAEQGTSFEVAWPLWEPARAAEPAQAAANTRGFPSGPAVLLIEDEAHVRKVMTSMLEYLDCTVTAADGGRNGLLLLQEHTARFDLVVLDWNMPGISGAQVLETVRALEPELPVLLLSGNIEGCTTDSDAYLFRAQKPLSLTQLEQTLCEALARSIG